VSTTDVPESRCLDCGRMMDRATDPLGTAIPVPGDITICFRCGHIMAFADDLTLRALTSDEMHAVAGNHDVIAYQKARGEVLKDDTD